MDAKFVKNGFTLIEVVIVITIIIIFSTYAIMRVSDSTSIKLYAQADQLANDIRFARTLAMTTGSHYYLSISGNTYTISSSAGTAKMMAFGTTSTTLSSGITFGTLGNLPSSLIAFNGLGTPYTDSAATTNALTSTATIPLNGGGKTATVAITPETGKVSIQ